ncbi:extracellular solute-binding protein [Ruania alba]|uniref:Putative aldouronate transport system substrate-binding protein n=1 Tax=Ruania alba TaxID=648782 RepID=A0A1H5BET6_9MICO|nr:extracellular solute-binding protein [Ruania alba]SED52758.1 putative aldouronate transport system substrate-binding protein [Ruania alba]
MSINRRRAAAGGLAMAMAMTAAACSSDTEGSEPGGPVTLSVFTMEGADQDLETNLFTEHLREDLGVEFDFQLTTYDGTAAAEARQISLASGDLPDVYMLVSWVDQFSQNELLNLSSQGVLIPLNDLIAEHAPNLQQAFEDHPDYEALATAPDGNIYGLPQWNDCFHCSYQAKLWMNSDWLDAVGMDMPTTTEEMREVLNAFLTEDPNGNGEADEIPLSGAVGIADVVPFFMNAFAYDPLGGESSTLSLALDGDQVVSQAVQPEWREGLEYLAALYEDGVIDQGAFTQNVEALQAKGNNADDALLGSCTAMHPAVCLALTDEEPRHTAYEAVPPLVGPDGAQHATYNFPSTPGAMFAITASATEAEQVAAIQMLDVLYSFEGHALGQFGPEGVAWRLPEEGDIALDETLEPTLARLPADPDDPASTNGAWGSNAQLYSPAEWRNTEVQPEDPYLAAGYERRLFEATELYAGHEPTDQIFPFWNVWVDGSMSSELAALQTNIESYIEQSTGEFVTGQRDITDDGEWAEYVDGLDALGLPRYLEIYQQAHEASGA